MTAGTAGFTIKVNRLRSASLGVIWLGTVLIFAGLRFGRNTGFSLPACLDPYYGVIGWLIAAALWPCTSGEQNSSARNRFRRLVRRVSAPRSVGAQWKLPAMTWLGIGSAVWLAAGYVHNLPAAFFVGLAAMLGMLGLCLAWFHLPFVATQIVVTLMLLCLGLPAADLLLNPPGRVSADPNRLKQYATYGAARKNPAGFEAWWQYFWNQWLELASKVLVYEPRAPVPLRLRPNGAGMLVQSHIRINSQGFRGPEIPPNKGNTYRIITLGESTTFGFTINASDQPWPELLEQLIRERLKPARPVEVINAWLPSADLPVNLRRFPSQILPLHPDLIICYHGINGFHLLDPAIPRTTGKAPPAYQPRPLRLLADCEYRMRLMHYRRASAAGLASQPPSFRNLMQTDFARAYRDLVEICETNHIRLALADFSMAANESSPAEVVEFFRPRTPRPYWVIQANAAHSEIVANIIHKHSELIFIDTHSHLDGEPNDFIDLVHFSHAGEVRMAENVFEGIRGLLEAELSPKRP